MVEATKEDEIMKHTHEAEIGDLVRIEKSSDVWHQKYGKIVKFGKNTPLKKEYEFYIETPSSGIIGYNREDIILIRREG